MGGQYKVDPEYYLQKENARCHGDAMSESVELAALRSRYIGWKAISSLDSRVLV